MLFVACSILFFFIILTGIGALIFRRKSCPESENPFLYTILSFFIIGITTMLFSFFTNIGPSFFYFFLVIGLYGIYANCPFFLKILKSKAELHLFLSYIIPLLFIVSLFLGYKVYPYASDTDTYHANSVEWIKQYGTVTGLANLMDRFGVNTIWHFVAAVLDNGPWSKRIVWIMPGLAYLCAFSFYIFEICFNKDLWKKLYSSCIIFWTFVNVLTWGFPSLHYDFFPLLVNSILIYFILSFSLENNKPSFNLSLRKLFIVLILSTESFILKPMGALSVIFSFLFVFHILFKSDRLTFKNIILLLAIPFISFCVWLARNILLSGWPLYPSPVFPLDFRWTAPESITRGMYEGIVGWARYPNPNPFLSVHSPISYWLLPWLKNSVTSIRFILVGTLPFLSAVVLWGMVLKTSYKKCALFIFIWCLSNIVFWFLSAPDIRFGDGLIICFFACAIVFIIQNRPVFGALDIIYKKFRYIIYFSIVLFCSVVFLTLYTGKRGPVNFLSIGQHGPGSIVQRVITLPNQETLKVWTPVTNQACVESQLNKICPKVLNKDNDIPNCGNSPLPCTSYFSKSLREFNYSKHSLEFYLID